MDPAEGAARGSSGKSKLTPDSETHHISRMVRGLDVELPMLYAE